MNVIVTGAARGIGLAITRALLAQGHEVVALVRDPAAARAALGEPAGLRLVQGSLGTIASARAAATALGDACPRIDVLLQNAGVWPSERRLTADGFEDAFMVNHLAPVLLYDALLPQVARPGGRLVQVSAGLYVKGRPDLARSPTGEDFGFWTYATAKLYNALACRALAEELPDGLTLNACHPGVIRTDLGDRGGALGWILRLAKRGWQTPEHGARGPVRLAVDPALAGVSGAYFNELEPMAWQPPADDLTLAREVLAHARASVSSPSAAAASPTRGA